MNSIYKLGGQYTIPFHSCMKKILFLLLLLPSLKALAQDTTLTLVKSPMMVDKLSNQIYKAVYTGTTVSKGVFQLDTELVYMVERLGYPHVSTFSEGSFPDLKIRYGLFEKLELRAGFRIGYSHHKIVLPPLGFGHDPILLQHERSMTYTDFMTLGVKAIILKDHKDIAIISILAEAPIPILKSREAFGPALQPTLTIINTNQVNHWFSFNLNAGANIDTSNSNHRIGAYNFSLTPIFSIIKPLSTYIGLSKRIAPHNPNFHGFNFHAGLLYSPTSTLQLRGSFSLERNKSTPYELNGHYSNLGLAWQPDFLRHQ